MPKASPLQSNFNGGEVSPLFYGRVDNDRYKGAVAVCKNYIPVIQGGMLRRSGSRFVNEVKTSAKQTRLVRFEFSVTQAYMLEFGENYIRFYKDYGIILDPDDLPNPYEVETAYDEDQIFDLKFTQSADVLYIFHPEFMPRKLSRRSHTDWTLAPIEPLDGPYLIANTTDWWQGQGPLAATFTMSAATGSTFGVVGPTKTTSTMADDGNGRIQVTTTAPHLYKTGFKVWIDGTVGTVEANGTWFIEVVSDTEFILLGSAFVNAWISGGTIYPALLDDAIDTGRLLRVKEGSVWGWGIIDSITDPAHFHIKIISTFTNTSAKTTWRLGVWSGTISGVGVGYPSCGVFHEDRLTLSGVPGYPQRVDMSKTGDYENFAPTATDGTVAADNAVGFSLSSSDVNVVRWLTSDEKGLLAGTVANEWNIRPSTQGEALSPTNVSAKKTTSYGSANTSPVQSGKATIYVQRALHKIREMNYFYDVDGFRATDLTVLAEHITSPGVSLITAQKDPQSIIWGVREDGILIGMTYERDQDQINAAWHRHQLGGVSDAAGTNAIVESIAIIPSVDGKREDMWMVVKRRIDGATVRYVEYLTKNFDDETDPEDAFFVDCGLTYDSPITMTAATKANPVVVTYAGADTLANGDKVSFKNVAGMEELNGNTYTVASLNTGANTFALTNVNNTGTGNVDGTSFGTYLSGSGEIRKLVTTITGLDHLEGETVSILADGAVEPDQEVNSGTIILTHAAGVVQIGLGYESDGQMLRLEAGAADGTALGKNRRTNQAGFLFHRTGGISVGTDFEELDPVVFRETGDALTRAVPLFTGVHLNTLKSNYDFENQICWRQDQPLPGLVLAVMPQLTTQDRG